MITIVSLEIEASSPQTRGWRTSKGLKRMFAGESFFLNQIIQPVPIQRYKASSYDAWRHRQASAEGRPYHRSRNGSFLCDSKLDIETGWQGFKNILSGESLFWVEIKGEENACRFHEAIYPVDVDGSYIMNAGHISFEESLNFNLSKAGSLASLGDGGEGIVFKFEGRGRVWCQSHNLRSFGFS